jgi:hypothetical protein
MNYRRPGDYRPWEGFEQDLFGLSPSELLAKRAGLPLYVSIGTIVQPRLIDIQCVNLQPEVGNDGWEVGGSRADNP